MSTPAMPWEGLFAWSQEHDLLAKRLYVVLSEPVSGLQPVLDNLDAHVAYQARPGQARPGQARERGRDVRGRPALR
jgi:hypothetical protein